MKRIIYNLSFLILLQSCYTYKNFETKNYENLQYDDVKIKLKDSTLLLGTVMEYGKEKLTIKNGKDVNEIIISDIKSIENKKFSTKKLFLQLLELFLVCILCLNFYLILLRQEQKIYLKTFDYLLKNESRIS